MISKSNVYINYNYQEILKWIKFNISKIELVLENDEKFLK